MTIKWDGDPGIISSGIADIGERACCDDSAPTVGVHSAMAMAMARGMGDGGWGIGWHGMERDGTAWDGGMGWHDMG